MIAIAGDGIAAGVLHRVLRDTPHVVFRKYRGTSCGIRPCGWGIAGSGLSLIEKLGVTPPVLRSDDHVIFAGRKIAADLHSIDKPELISRLLKGADFQVGPPRDIAPDVIVDATGLARAYIGPADNDYWAVNFQMKVKFPDHSPWLVPRFTPIHGGYHWFIPLGDDEAHIGLGSVTLSMERLRDMFFLMRNSTRGKIICTCSEPVRLSGLTHPILRDDVIAVGEAAGAVAPLGGAGIVPAITSAIVVGAILREGGTLRDCALAQKHMFSRFNGQRKALSRMVRRGKVHPFDYLRLYLTTRYMGVDPGFRDLLHMVRSINRGLSNHT